MLATFLLATLSFAQELSKLQFEVKGNCSMCKERIETTAKSVGAHSAQWSASTQQLTLELDSLKTSPEKVLQAIANAGHDNELFTAPDSVYNALPSCCLYERDSSTKAAAISTEQYFVKGNCDMCKARIENTALSAGAMAATWEANNQTLVLSLDNSTSADTILKAIAQKGHDNELHKAPDAVYKALPACCLYDRNAPLGKVTSLVHSDRKPQAQDHVDHSDHIDKSIEGVNITKAQAATSLSNKSAGLIFNISEKELLKAACCNLAESFETNATVDVAFSNAVTGTKQLRMLGLDQKYTALTKELLPEIRGLASAYGLNFIPGRWIQGIQLTKGGSTVTAGYESITGQINTELLKFGTEPETTLNLFSDINGRNELNITNTSPLNTKWNQSILLHANATIGKMDYNDDGFLDQPTGSQLNMTYLLNYNDLENTGWGSHFGINLLSDQRYGGQTAFDRNRPQSEQSSYGVGIKINRAQLWNKSGYIFKGKPYQSIGFMNQFTYHEQNSFFGPRTYQGEQKSFYSNLIFESILGNTNHKYKAGASYLYDDYEESYLQNPYMRTESVPGLFFEYTLTGLKYTLVAGARTDFHNLAGTQFTPRVNFKYDITPQHILRLSAGKGFRTANVFAESQSYFASNREIVITPSGGSIYGLKPEIAWNYGASIQNQFKLFGRTASLVTDFFRTDFTDQVVLDLDQSTRQIHFYNLEGSSFANSLQTQLDLIPLRNLELRLAYKYYDVQTDYANGRNSIPFIAKHRGFVNAAYTTPKNSKGGFWSFDSTLNLVGKQRLANTAMNPVPYQLAQYSDPYSTLNMQIAHNFNEKFRLYAGAENLTGTVQDKPIIDAANPFGNYFDASMVYAPIMPANIYLGVDLAF